MIQPKVCTLLSFLLLWRLPSFQVGAVKQSVQSRALKHETGGILSSFDEAWEDTAKVSKTTVETRCRKPSRRRLQKSSGSKSSSSKSSLSSSSLSSSSSSSGSSKSGKGPKGSNDEAELRDPDSKAKGKGSKSKAKGKGSKSKKGDVPYCDDLNRVTQSPTPVPNNSQDLPTNSAPAPSPTPAGSNVKDCSAIAAGTARMDGSNKSFDVSADLIVDGSVDIQTILTKLEQILQQQVAPALAGCLANTRRRRLQESDDTNIVNVVFGTPAISDDQCTSTAVNEADSNLSCLTALFGATVYYFGSAPVGFVEALKAAIEAGGNLGIDGLLGIFSPQVVDTSTANPDGSQTTPTEPGEVNQASVANTTASDGNNTNVAGAQGPEDPSIGGGDDRSVGAAIGITAAGLGLVLLVLLVAGRRRRRSNTDKIEGGLVHRQFTDDEEEDGDFSGTYAREIDVGSHAKNLAQVVGEDDDSVVIRWGEGKVVGGQDIYSQPVESIWSSDERKVMESHSCSSPSCKVCEMKTQEGVGIQFFASPKSSTTPVPLSRESRSYMSNDTVDL